VPGRNGASLGRVAVSLRCRRNREGPAPSAPLQTKKIHFDPNKSLKTNRRPQNQTREPKLLGMSSAIYHTVTVELMTRLMKERGIPVILNSFKGRKGDNYNFGRQEPLSN